MLIGMTTAGSSYKSALESVGAATAIVSDIRHIKDKEAIAKILAIYDGFLFTGGSDIDPGYYLEKELSLTMFTSPTRDDNEFKIMQHVWNETNKPIFGVCRGLQLMNVFRGGTLYQDIHSQIPTETHESSSSFSEAHMACADMASRIGREILPSYFPINSMHHQGIKDLGKGLRPVAYSPDGLIEAIECEKHDFRAAFQWHPEEMYSTHPYFKRLFAEFVEVAREISEENKKSETFV